MGTIRRQLAAGLSIVVVVDDAALSRQLAQMRERAEHARPFWAEVGNILRRAWRRNFATGGIPAWTPLAASTVAAKRDAGMPSSLRTKTGRVPRRLMQNGSLSESTILVRSGKLRDSLCRRGAPGNIARVTDTGGEFGTSVEYAGVHEYGGRGPYAIRAVRARTLAFMGGDSAMVFRREVIHPALPQRRMTTLTEADIRAIEEAGHTFLLGRPMNTTEE